MGGGPIHDPITDWTRKTMKDAGLFGSGPNADLISQLVVTGPGDIADLGAYGKIQNATKPKSMGSPEAPPAPPTVTDPAVNAAQMEQRRARGRSSTILTAPGGNGASSTGLIARRTLLGT